ncbi:MAG: CheR family methyltransferase [Panacagrimonas sp.]
MLERIAALLKHDLGLEAELLGVGAIERAVRERQAARQLDDAAAYWALLCQSGEERQALIEAVVVPETWFFRDHGAFEALVQQVLPDWRRNQAGGPMRLLSLPCSTGEEPYSLAMALLDAGLDACAFRIDAIDISERALAIARRAVYRRNSFRGRSLEFCRHHFDAEGQVYQVRSSVTACVQFRHGNLFDAAIFRGVAPYDAVFCRNLLIYFDRPTQNRAMRVLGDLVAARGFLFLGPSEAALALGHRWTQVNAALSFGFRRPGLPAAEALPRPTPVGVAVVPRPAARPPAARKQEAAVARRDVGQVTATPRPSARADSDLLLEAERLADEGRLREASQRCESFLERYGPHAMAFYLLGLVCDAQGDPDAAAAHYRKVLYLEPAHHEALVHLAMILERKGDAAGARVLRGRALRRTTPEGARR